MSHVHLLDPSPTFQRLARATLGQHGLSVAVAQTPQDLPSDPPDVLVVAHSLLDPQLLAWIQETTLAWPHMRICVLGGEPHDLDTLTHARLTILPALASTLDTLDALEAAILGAPLSSQATAAFQRPVHTPPRMRLSLVHDTPEPRSALPGTPAPGDPPRAFEQQIDTVRTTYGKRLPTLFDTLEQHLLQAREGEPASLHLALQITRKIHGTAGSFGFLRTAEAMGSLERALDALSHPADPDLPPPWSGAIRALADARATLDTLDHADAAHSTTLPARRLLLDAIPPRDADAWSRAARLLGFLLDDDAPPLGRVLATPQGFDLYDPQGHPCAQTPHTFAPLYDALIALQHLLAIERGLLPEHAQDHSLHALDLHTGLWRPAALLRLLTLQHARAARSGERFALGLLALHTPPDPQRNAALRAWSAALNPLLIAGWWTPTHLLLLAEGRDAGRIEQTLDQLAQQLQRPHTPPCAWGCARTNAHDEPLDDLLSTAWTRLLDGPAR